MRQLQLDCRDCLARLRVTQMERNESQAECEKEHKLLRKSRNTTADQANTIAELHQQLAALSAASPDSSPATAELQHSLQESQSKATQQASEIRQLQQQLTTSTGSGQQAALKACQDEVVRQATEINRG